MRLATRQGKSDRHFSIVLLHDEEMRFLLQLRGKEKEFLPNHWCFFGGDVFEHESPASAARREADRELGYVLKRPAFVLASTFEHLEFRAHLYVYAEPCRQKFSLQLHDGEDWGWFRVKELDRLNMQQHDRDLIRFTHAWLASLQERHAAIIVLYDREGRILLQLREDDRSFLPGHWSFFGGGIEPGETSREAVQREAYEELGCWLRRPVRVLQTTFQHPALWTHIDMYVEPCEDTSKLALREGRDWGWFTVEDARALRMLESDRYLLSYVSEYIKHI